MLNGKELKFIEHKNTFKTEQLGKFKHYMIKEIIGELPVVYIADYNDNAVVRSTSLDYYDVEVVTD